ncbi:MAG: sigma-70 family RNA polymerase sigma factor [Rickettsiales bacterium]
MVHMIQSPPDEQLMEAVASGDGHAFDALVRRHLPRAYAIARRVLSNQADAEEAAQDAFTKIWVKAADWQPDRAKFTTWLHRIVVNSALDMARKRTPGFVADAEAVLATLPDATPNIEAQLGQAEQQALVRQAVATLTPEQRAAVTLCYFEHYTNVEAAKMLGINLKALEGLLVRARKKLRETLGPMEHRHAA